MWLVHNNGTVVSFYDSDPPANAIAVDAGLLQVHIDNPAWVFDGITLVPPTVIPPYVPTLAEVKAEKTEQLYRKQNELLGYVVIEFDGVGPVLMSVYEADRVASDKYLLGQGAEIYYTRTDLTQISYTQHLTDRGAQLGLTAAQYADMVRSEANRISQETSTIRNTYLQRYAAVQAATTTEQVEAIIW